MLEFIPARQVQRRLSEGWQIFSYEPGDYAAVMYAPEWWQPLLLDNKKPFRACTVPACVEKHKARGFCSLHYDRFKTYGDPHIILPKGRTLHTGCKVPGCTNKHRGRGLCGMHLQRARKEAKRAFECSEAA